jgi:hypothetical protein
MKADFLADYFLYFLWNGIIVPLGEVQKPISDVVLSFV